MDNPYLELYYKSLGAKYCIPLAIILMIVVMTITGWYEFGILAFVGAFVGSYLFLIICRMLYALLRYKYDRSNYRIIPNYSEGEMEARLLQKFTSEINPKIVYTDTPANNELLETCKAHSINCSYDEFESLRHNIHYINKDCVITSHFGTYSSRKKYKETFIPSLTGHFQNDVMAIINTLKNTENEERRKILYGDWENVVIGCVITYKGVFITIALHNLDKKHLEEKENKKEE